MQVAMTLMSLGLARWLEHTAEGPLLPAGLPPPGQAHSKRSPPPSGKAGKGDDDEVALETAMVFG